MGALSGAEREFLDAVITIGNRCIASQYFSVLKHVTAIVLTCLGVHLCASLGEDYSLRKEAA